MCDYNTFVGKQKKNCFSDFWRYDNIALNHRSNIVVLFVAVAAVIVVVTVVVTVIVVVAAVVVVVFCCCCCCCFQYFDCVHVFWEDVNIMVRAKD